VHRFPQIVEYDQQLLYQLKFQVLALLLEVLLSTAALQVGRARIACIPGFLLQVLDYLEDCAVLVVFRVERRYHVPYTSFVSRRRLSKSFAGLLFFEVVFEVFEDLIDLWKGELFPIVVLDVLVNIPVLSKLIGSH
jgi:hypothetical protein